MTAVFVAFLQWPIFITRSSASSSMSQSIAKSEIFTPTPHITSLFIPPGFDGSRGTNRATGNRRLIAANNDIDAIKAWLTRYVDTKTTFANYRKEAERLLLWSTLQLEKPLSSLTHEDLLAYQYFLADPQPAERWVMRGGRRFARSHAEWRPFAGPLSSPSQRQTMTILNTMFSWLVNAGYLAGNPLSLSRRRRFKTPPRMTRYLEKDLWNEVKQTIEAMPKESKRECEHYFRNRWLFTLLYLCGLRISEVVNNTMGDFFCRPDRHGQKRWWLEVVGKGDKTRLIPATTELLAELSRYRGDRGLPPLPINAETTPLLLPIGGQQRPMTRGAVHSIVKRVFQSTALRLEAYGPSYKGTAARVKAASTHWMRHTAGSHMANGAIDLCYVRDTLGHESIATTSKYLHSSDDDRHQETEARHRINW
ncbi:tyrosine-type recombinase/integrase [Herbaspirillum sp. GCM10030257]|uniref:tyrosine-type recombinase/integrase n=1 Tax=Herbaspirillum sp. GCM10030257 TaxID=3273393 RepID=UPI00360EC91C